MLRKIFLFAIVLTLVACTSTPIQSTRISNKKPLAEDNGVVAVQVINNSDRLSTWHKGWTEVILFRTDNIEQKKQQAITKAKQKHKGKKEFDPDKVDWEPDYFTLSPHSKGVLDSQVFVGTLPAGEYMISNLYSFYNGGDFTSWVSMPVMFSAGKFTVRAKQLTNLGSVVFQPLLNIVEKSFWNNRSSQKAYVTRIAAQEDLSQYIFAQYPHLAGQLNTNQALGWLEDDLTNYREKLSALSRANAYGDTTIALNTHGKGMVASKFGLIKWQDKSGQWHKTNIDTNTQLAAGIELDKHIVIGGELGQVFITDNMAGKWQMIQPVPSTQAITWFGKTAQTNYAVAASSTSYHVYAFTKIEGKWSEIGVFDAKGPSFWVVNGGVFPILTKEGNIRIINDNKRYDYDRANDKWIASPSRSFVKLEQLPNGVIVALDISQWDGVGDQYISHDSGESWLKVNRRLDLLGDNKPDQSLPTFLNDGTVVSLGRVKADKQSRSQLMLISSSANKVTQRDAWDAHHAVKAGCYTMLPKLVQDQTLYFLCEQGHIVSTDDFGKSWQDVVKIDIAAMQQSFEQLLDAMEKPDEEEEEVTHEASDEAATDA